jgi:hypothetical protein
MRTRSRFDDQQLLRQLLAPPALDDGIQSLTYWRERWRRLPWYRIAARREAARMMIRWERRVAAALAAQPGAPVSTSMSAALLLARTRLARWGRHAGIAVLVTISVVAAVVAIPVAVAVVLLLQTL